MNKDINEVINRIMVLKAPDLHWILELIVLKLNSDPNRTLDLELIGTLIEIKE